MINQLKRRLDHAILTGDVNAALEVFRAAADHDHAVRIARGPTEKDIKLARMMKARKMPYDKWALGEK